MVIFLKQTLGNALPDLYQAWISTRLEIWSYQLFALVPHWLLQGELLGSYWVRGAHKKCSFQVGTDGSKTLKNILLIAAISFHRAFPSLSKILGRRFSGKVWRPFLTDPLIFLSSLLHCKSFVRQCSQRCCAESGQTVFAPSGWFSFSASKTSPERLRKPGEFSLSRRFITADSFPWKTNIQ